MAEMIDFSAAGQGVMAKRLATATEQLSTALREAMLNHLRDLQACNLVDLQAETQLQAINAMTKVKALIAETYPDVHERLATMAIKTGVPVTDEDAAKVCRELHPECFIITLA